jgi:hypothetical protein
VTLTKEVGIWAVPSALSFLSGPARGGLGGGGAGGGFGAAAGVAQGARCCHLAAGGKRRRTAVQPLLSRPSPAPSDAQLAG